ncbi:MULTISPECIES: PP2C family protein-serine/threonine phosphatase [Nonomuraea]|uniref:PP2C family protein-serine/threonine phosphatase n=1 Tax=Nonomuraea ferruginea TaxID=46174 RepID=A0ABT4TAC4_9ACTN|nr:PP2C family protein-serine/threonine phosphatase [Nonomuraea ferruginea]MDA0646463.1 PP2C family protein-serine/threonine phosphatase [Nonomuraea ferruginea]
MSGPRDVRNALSGLLRDGQQATLEDLPNLAARHAPQVGVRQCLIYLADLQQSTLRLLAERDGPYGHPGAPDDVTEDKPPDDLRIDATYGGRAFQEVRILRKPAERGMECWWVPLLNGAERLGALRVLVERPDDVAEEDVLDLAQLLALLVAGRRSFSDSYTRLVRSRRMNVAAEMLWHLMPPLTFANAEVTIAGVLEPAYEIGGDAFDYALGDEIVHLAIFDAMGHDVAAGLAANLVMAASRNLRRDGACLAATSEGIENMLLREFGETARFVTAIMADFDLRTGMLSWVNRGHHPPVLIRAGRWVTTLDCPPTAPFGLGLELPAQVCHEQLEPGDRLLMYTDGIVEAGRHRGEQFGMERFVDFILRHSCARLPVPETLRRLIKDVMDHHEGRLQDDATVLLTEWHGRAGA